MQLNGERETPRTERKEESMSDRLIEEGKIRSVFSIQYSAQRTIHEVLAT